jgi:1,4-dihydroxy-2-naphthoate octaprenyltransferase
MINQFPDRRADEAAGKRHWVVRLRPRAAARGYAGIAVTAYAWLVAAVILK